MDSQQTDKRYLASRSPKRISITIPHAMFEKIVERSTKEGRSLSNLAAFILENGIDQ
jgi:hypothetical protein